MSERPPIRIYFIFVDGIGLGDAAPRQNPFASFSLPVMERLAEEQKWTREARFIARDDRVFRPLDATLGLPGLPQSGTGQASLMTGVNCAELAGRHFGPYPHSATKPIIATQNVFRRIGSLPSPPSVAFANAYPQRFFDFVSKNNRWTVTTLCCAEAGVRLRSDSDVLDAEAITADMTGEGWQKMGYTFEPILEQEAGSRFHNIGRAHGLTLFEYYLTDKAGHSQSFDRAHDALARLDRFLEGFLRHFDPQSELLLITSDHGNLEDLSVKVHTRNPVPLIAYGGCAAHFASAESILDVTPGIVRALTAPP